MPSPDHPIGKSTEGPELTQPNIGANLPDMNPLTRAAEALRWGMMTTEQILSPEGRLRRWMLWCGYRTAWLGIPAVTLLPIALIVCIQVAAIAQTLHRAAWYVLLALVCVIIIKVIVEALVGKGQR